MRKISPGSFWTIVSSRTQQYHGGLQAIRPPTLELNSPETEKEIELIADPEPSFSFFWTAFYVVRWIVAILESIQ